MESEHRRTDEERRRESQDILDRAQSESGTVLSSAMARAARHFGAADAPAEDRVEVWGKRIARALALLFVLYLLGDLTGAFGR
ncbi:hypothetical protein GCM10007036_45960 [Alsobacter metallidurans]|uniref:Uncharacterized protein n=1 Tax=Alsobacter metallidurans TaxID=340221 RepID=A0A917MJU0_9HYPH|nr:hypothetical protein GCM10007036_45960 [Alsobacter metallidurans]